MILNRRRFLISAAAPCLLRSAPVSASEGPGILAIGVGGRGGVVALAAAQQGRVVACCDVDTAKAEGFLPGGASLHNCMSAHGPDAETWERASKAELKPHKVDDTMAFMFETRFAMRLTRYAMESSELQQDYFEGWQGLNKNFKG